MAGCDLSDGSGVRIVDVCYRQDGDGAWPARIYMPPGPGPFPALLDVHGGAWTRGAYTENETVDRSLAAAGLAVFAIEFRQSPRHPYPAQVADVNYAARWVKAHAGAYNAVADRLGGFGTSSGGHTLLLSAMRIGDSRYGALPLPRSEHLDARLSYVIAAWPVIDPHERYLFAAENGRDFLVEATEAYFPGRESMKEGSPLFALERGEPLDLPPVLILQGTADENVPLASVHRFTDAYRAAGGDVELRLFAGMPHGFAGWPGAASERALEIMKDFIRRRLAGPAMV